MGTNILCYILLFCFVAFNFWEENEIVFFSLQYLQHQPELLVQLVSFFFYRGTNTQRKKFQVRENRHKEKPFLIMGIMIIFLVVFFFLKKNFCSAFQCAPTTLENNGIKCEEEQKPRQDLRQKRSRNAKKKLSALECVCVCVSDFCEAARHRTSRNLELYTAVLCSIQNVSNVSVEAARKKTEFWEVCSHKSKSPFTNNT